MVNTSLPNQWRLKSYNDNHTSDKNHVASNLVYCGYAAVIKIIYCPHYTIKCIEVHIIKQSLRIGYAEEKLRLTI